MGTIGRKKKSKKAPHPTKQQSEQRVRFALLLLDRMATPREVQEALMAPPRIDEATGKKGGGLGLTVDQAQYAYAAAVKRRAGEFEEERAVARSEQGARLRAWLSLCMREKKVATGAQYERLYGALYGTFAPQKIRVEAGGLEADIARALAGMSEEDRAVLLAGADRDDEEP